MGQHWVCFWKFSIVRLAVNAGMDPNLRDTSDARTLCSNIKQLYTYINMRTTLLQTSGSDVVRLPAC